MSGTNGIDLLSLVTGFIDLEFADSMAVMGLTALPYSKNAAAYDVP